MKELRSKKMKMLLAKAFKKWIRDGKKIPSDGYMNSLIYEDSKNGWHYQGDIVNDRRFYKFPVINIFAFKPPRVYHAKSAEYVITKEISK